MAKLAVVPAVDVEALPGSIATWAVASKLAMDLVARERMVPTITRRGGRIEARWAAALASGDDAAKAVALAKSMPPAAHAVPAGVDSVWAPDALLRVYLDAVIDAVVRVAQGAPDLLAAEAGASRPNGSWDERWRTALGTSQRASRPTASQSGRSSMTSRAGASPRWVRVTGCAPVSGSSWAR
jgi:hypothetical protein